MALRDQPYLPLYIQDFLTDEKLNECSANAHGIYIKIMCLLHKSETYGKFLLEQRYKQNDKPLVNFAHKFARHLPFDFAEILDGLTELSFNGVIQFDENALWQKRMIRDNEISELRAEAGSKGGKKTQFDKAKYQANIEAKTQANTENECAIENSISSSLEKSEKPFLKTWRTDFEIYKAELMKVYNQLIIDPAFISERKKYHPTLDISLSLEKAVNDFWGTEAGWKHKKKKKDNIEIDWVSTLQKALDLPSNQVKKQYATQRTATNNTTDARKQQEEYGVFKPGDEPSARIVSAADELR